MNKPVVLAEPRQEVAEHESDKGTDEADEEALEEKDAPHLTGLDSHGEQDGDVFGLLHDHHGEGDEDIQCGDTDDEADDDEGDDLLELEGAEELTVLFHPVRGGVAAAGGLLNCIAYDIGAIKIVDAEGDDGDEVGLAEEALGVGEADEAEARIVLIKAGVEDARDAEAL